MSSRQPFSVLCTAWMLPLRRELVVARSQHVVFDVEVALKHVALFVAGRGGAAGTKCPRPCGPAS